MNTRNLAGQRLGHSSNRTADDQGRYVLQDALGNPERLSKQITRIRRLAGRLFPGCSVLPRKASSDSFSLQMLDTAGVRLGFMTSRSVQSYEKSSDKQIEIMISANVERWKSLVAGEVEGF